MQITQVPIIITYIGSLSYEMKRKTKKQKKDKEAEEKTSFQQKNINGTSMDVN